MINSNTVRQIKQSSIAERIRIMEIIFQSLKNEKTGQARNNKIWSYPRLQRASYRRMQLRDACNASVRAWGGRKTGPARMQPPVIEKIETERSFGVDKFVYCLSRN